MSVAAAPAAPRPVWRRAPSPTAALGLVCLAAGALIVGLGVRLSFFNDDWYLLLQRPGMESHGGLDTLLAPHNGNMVVVLAAVYKLLVSLFGMSSQWPFRVVLGVSWAALGAVVYALVRPRVGAGAALLASTVLLFLGPAWEVALFFGGINHLWALTLGLGALLLLHRDTPAANAGACALLVLAVGSSNTGLALTAACAIAVITRRRPVQLWIVAVPLAVFGMWWLGYGHNQSTGVTLGHIEALPGYVYDALSIGFAALLGLEHGRLPGALSSGHLPAVLALIALAVWLARGGRPRMPALWFAGGLVVFWLLTGASAIPGRGAISSRYQLTDAALLIVLTAELAHGVSLPRTALAGLGLVALIVVIANLIVLHDGYRFLRIEAQYAAADTGALRIAGPLRAGDTWLLKDVAGDPYLSGITATRYFAQTARYGTPAFDTPVQLAAAAPDQRAAADGVLIAADALAPHVISGSPLRGCTSLAPPPGTRTSVALPTGTSVIDNRGAAVLALFLSRFGPAATAHGVAFLAPHVRQAIAIPADGSTVPWRLTVENPQRVDGAVSVCGS